MVPGTYPLAWYVITETSYRVASVQCEIPVATATPETRGCTNNVYMYMPEISHTFAKKMTTPNTTESTLARMVNPFSVGQLVKVAARTWPGINEPGGVGRVVNVTPESVSVRYLVGHRRQEKNVPVQYVAPHILESSRLRDRSMLLGRCKNCGSLRTDCGSCDIWVAEQQIVSTTSSSITVLPPYQGKPVDEEQIVLIDDDSESEDLSDLDNDVERLQTRFQRYQRIKRRAERLLHECLASNDNGEHATSSDSDRDDDLPLRQLVNQTLKHRSQVRGKDWIVDPSARCEATDDQSSVSNPGSPDLSDSERSAPEASRNREYERTVEESHSDGDESNEGVLMDVTATQHDFIQPEGNADELPSDVRDLSKHLDKNALLCFIIAMSEKIQNVLIPSSSQQVDTLDAAVVALKPGSGDWESLLMDW